MKQTILPFKVEKTEDLITPNAGLAIYLELYRSAKINRDVRDLFPKPGSAKGFHANVYVVSIVMLFLSGGKYIEDIRKLKLDKALKKVGKIGRIPSADAIGDWMRTKSVEKIQAIESVHKKLTKRFLKQSKRRDHTLDIDAFSIFSNKDSANYTYKGEKGYMPIAGHLAELDWCIGYEFREGQVPPAERNYEFIMHCFNQLPKGHKITAFRSDAAAYQARIVNELDRRKIKFTITAAKKGQIMPSINQIKEEEWRPLKNKQGIPTNRMVAETYSFMKDTPEHFRIVVQRWANPKRDLFNNEPEFCYHVIATNYSQDEKSAVDVIYFHNQRSNSENYHKEAKGGFNLEYLPCDDFHANAFWFAIGLLSYNVHILAKEYLLPESWRKKTIQTIRWQLIHVAGKVVKHARDIWLKLAGLSDELFSIFKQARYNCWRFASP